MIHDEMIVVIQAHKEGKVIEYKYYADRTWLPCTSPVWDFDSNEYRIKKEPRTFLVAVNATGVPVGVAVDEPGAFITVDTGYGSRVRVPNTYRDEWLPQIVRVQEVLE